MFSEEIDMSHFFSVNHKLLKLKLNFSDCKRASLSFNFTEIYQFLLNILPYLTEFCTHLMTCMYYHN